MSGKKIKGAFSKGAGFLRKANLAGNIARKAGVSDSNFFAKLTNPGGDALKATEEGGLKGALEYGKSGEVTDPLHVFHRSPAADIPDPGAPPSPENISAQAGTARDRVRRAAYRAQGRRSTIRTQGLLGSYTGNTSQLLGS